MSAQPLDKIRVAGAEIAKKLERIEAFMELFFDYPELLLCVAKKDGYFEWVSKSWVTQLGWTREEMLARPWIDFVHPDDVKKTLVASDEMKDHGVINFVNRYQRKDGTWVSLKWKTITWNGNGTAYCVAKVLN